MRVKKIDIHAHVIPEVGICRPNGDHFPTPAEMMAINAFLGIERTVTLPEIGVEATSEQIGNRETKMMVEKYPDNFSWFCNIDPRMVSNSDKTDFSHLIEYYKSVGAKGVGELCCNVYFDDPKMLNLFSYCEKYDMPVIFHLGNMGNDYGLVDEIGLPRMEKVLGMFPKLRFLGHSQKFWAEISGDCNESNRGGYPKGKVVPGGRVPELMRKYPNLYGDMSAGSGANAFMRDPEHAYKFIEEFQDRLLFGTDICDPRQIDDPMLKLAEFLDEAMEQDKISYEAYYKVSRGNALKLLGVEETK